MQDVWKDVVTSRDDREPLWYQLVLGIRHQVAYGRAQSTDVLPSLRDGALLWQVNMHTVRKAYQQLRDEGIISFEPGRPARVIVQPTAGAGSQHSVREFLDTTVRMARDDFGLSLAELVDALQTLEPDRKRQQKKVWVLECSAAFREYMAAQIRRRWHVDAEGWDMDDAQLTPEGDVVGTYFHYNELRSKLSHRLSEVQFVAVHYEASGVREAARMARLAKGEVIVATRDPVLLPVIEQEVKGKLPRDVKLRSVSGVAPDKLLRERKGPPVLFTPPLWDMLSAEKRQHPRAFPLRTVIATPDLDRLGTAFGWS